MILIELNVQFEHFVGVAISVVNNTRGLYGLVCTLHVCCSIKDHGTISLR